METENAAEAEMETDERHMHRNILSPLGKLFGFGLRLKLIGNKYGNVSHTQDHCGMCLL